MRIQDYLKATVRHWVAVLICTLAIACAALAYGIVHPPSYAATAKNYVTVDLASSVSDLNLGGSYAQQVVGSYVDVATTPIVLNRVIRQLDLKTSAQELATSIQVSAPTDSLVITVVATDPSPSRAADIANATSASLEDAVASLTPQIRSSGASVRISQIEPATVSPRAIGPSIVAQALGGVLIGLLVGIVAAVLLEATNRRLRDARDLRTASGAPVLGRTLVAGTAEPDALTVQLDPWGGSAESFRQLRTTLQYMDPAGAPQVVAVAAARQSAAVAVVAANTALAFGDAGSPAVLIDADLRHGRLSRMLGKEAALGLTDVLSGGAALSQVVDGWGSGSLQVLPRGTEVGNPSELLQSDAMTALIAEIRRRYRVAVIDAGSLLETTDGSIAVHHADGTVVVVPAGRVDRASLDEAEKVLQRINAPQLGLVLADANPRPATRARKPADPAMVIEKTPAPVAAASRTR